MIGALCKGRYPLVTLHRTVTPYRDSVDGTCNHVTYQKLVTQLRWVHTCNVTAYRNAVTLQETDAILSYELNFHPVPHGVTVSCERYILAFPVCYGSSTRW